MMIYFHLSWSEPYTSMHFLLYEEIIHDSVLHTNALPLNNFFHMEHAQILNVHTYIP